jgi:hypothetical protein
VWSVGQLLDDQGDVLHSVGLVAGADAVLHLERFVRYGEKTPIRGVETLNYVMTNEPVDRDGFRVEWPGGEAFVRVGDWRLDDAGDALLLDRRLAVVRVWGNTRLCAEQRRAERVRNGINPARPWRLRVWGERVGPQAPDPYAVLAEQVVLFVPAASVQEALAAGRAVTVSASPMGRWEVRVGLPAWRGAFAVDFGTDLAFYDFGLDGDAARGLSAQRREKWRKDVGHE